MTNHPKFTESHDSAARSVGYEGARESRKAELRRRAWRLRDEVDALLRQGYFTGAVDRIFRELSEVNELPKESCSNEAPTGVE